MTFADAKQRFSSRVADYIRYRPRYPEAVLDFLRADCGLRPEQTIADVGSGTGFLSELFLKNGNRVFGVEPNEAMRQAGEEILAPHSNFTSVRGAAEATTLPDTSVDFVTVAQAFHWFDRIAARREFRRILKTPGWVVILGYRRDAKGSSFTRAFEDFVIRFAIDYERVKEAYPTGDDVASFLETRNYIARDFSNPQNFDIEGVRGLVKSSSYMPGSDHSAFTAMMAELQNIFSQNEKGGIVRIDYQVQVYCGVLHGEKNSA